MTNFRCLYHKHGRSMHDRFLRNRVLEPCHFREGAQVPPELTPVRLPVNGTMPLTAVQTPLPRTRVPPGALTKHTRCALSLSSLHPATYPNEGNRLLDLWSLSRPLLAWSTNPILRASCASSIQLLASSASSIHLIVPPINTHYRQGAEGGNK
jgi:hypothetical protein